ncbi:MAG: glycosyltransferase family 4 protein [Pseudanabaenaceae cyanobacterium]
MLPYLEQGGTEKHTLSLIAHFRQYYHVSLLAPPGSTAHQFTDLGVPHYQFSRWDLRFAQGVAQLYRSLRAIHQQVKIDLIHVHAAHELVLAIKLFLPQVPIVFTVHGYHGATKDWSYWLSSQMANWAADRVIAVCRCDGDILRQCGLQPDKLTVIYNGVPTPPIAVDACQELRGQLQLQEGEIVLGTLARLTPEKGISYLLQAFYQLSQEYDYLRLVIAGEGKQRGELEKLVTQLNLGSKVNFLGYIDRPHNFLALVDIFVLPSLQEAFSLAILEAMALAKPIVATAVGGTPEQMGAGKAGILVPPRSISGLITALTKLIADPQLRRTMGQLAQAYYRENFRLETMLQRTALLYCDVLKSWGAISDSVA